MTMTTGAVTVHHAAGLRTDREEAGRVDRCPREIGTRGVIRL